MPEVNCSYVNNMMRHYKTIDINVAVSIPDGLITPVLHDVDKTGLLSLNQQMKKLIGKCKEGPNLRIDGTDFSAITPEEAVAHLAKALEE